MPGTADRICLHGRRLADRGGLKRGVHAADVGGAAVPLGAVARRPGCACASDPVDTGGNSSAATAARGPAVRRASTARAGPVHPSRPRTARASVGNGVMLAGSWWPAATSARSTAPGPSRAISRSVAMLSLAEIICCAAVRTDTVRAGREFLEARGSDRLGLLGDGQRVVPAHRPGLDRIRNRKQHIEFEDRRQRQRQIGVACPPSPTHLPAGPSGTTFDT